MPRLHLIQVRAGTAAEWAAADPVLANKEPGYVTDTKVLKVGNGTSKFSELTGIAGGLIVSGMLTTRQIPYVPAIPNILNPGFEASTLTGWTIFSVGDPGTAANALNTSIFHGGMQSLQLSSTANWAVYGVYQNLDLRDTSHVTVWAYCSQSLQIRISAKPVPTAYGDFENLGSPDYETWTQYTYEIPEAYRVKDGRISIGILSSSGAISAYLDDVSYILDGTVNQCNFIPDVDDYIDDEVDIRLSMPAKTTKKQVLFRQVTGELGDYGWIVDIEDFINDTVDSHIGLPAKTTKKQVPFRSYLRDIVINGTMDAGPLIPPEHFFTTASIDALINPNHFFVDDTARNTYFSSNPSELVEGLLIYSWYRYQKYISSAWVDQDTDDLIDGIAADYFTAHPAEQVEGAYRYMGYSTPAYQRYTSSAWTSQDEEDLTGGWLPSNYGCTDLVLSADTTEEHEGTGCLKTTFTTSGSDWYGGGIKQYNADLTEATSLKIWLKGDAATAGKELRVTGPFISASQEITDGWVEYTVPIPEAQRGPGKLLEIDVGGAYTSDFDYVVYWDLLSIIGGITDEIEWIPDIDTYHDDTYVKKNASITGAAKCKITYDAKGLVTGSADLAETDLPVSTMRFRGSAASDPADSRAGDCYLNTGDSKLYMHNGTGYIALT